MFSWSGSSLISWRDSCFLRDSCLFWILLGFFGSLTRIWISPDPALEMLGLLTELLIAFFFLCFFGSLSSFSNSSWICFWSLSSANLSFSSSAFLAASFLRFLSSTCLFNSSWNCAYLLFLSISIFWESDPIFKYDDCTWLLFALILPALFELNWYFWSDSDLIPLISGDVSLDTIFTDVLTSLSGNFSYIFINFSSSNLNSSFCFSFLALASSICCFSSSA